MTHPPHQPLPINDEMSNFIALHQRIAPHTAGDELGEIEVYGTSRFLNGEAGGDHIVYLNFDKRFDLNRRAEEAQAKGDEDLAAKILRNRHRLGVLLADVAGHKLTDALVTAMLHQAFLTGVLYELDIYGEVTTHLFENLNTRFQKSTSIERYVTLIYGEISDTGNFRFILAGHPPPMVFSNEYEQFVNISKGRLKTFYPLGMFPSEDDVDASRNLGALRYKPRYTVNEVNLMSPGDIMILFSDGLSEHCRNDDENFVNVHLQDVVRSVKEGSAKDIQQRILSEMADFATFDDDTTIVVIKRR